LEEEDEDMTKYVGIRKVKWDQMFHAILGSAPFKINYDRVSLDEAKAIAAELLWGDAMPSFTSRS
jgi:hypothetical protein